MDGGRIWRESENRSVILRVSLSQLSRRTRIQFYTSTSTALGHAQTSSGRLAATTAERACDPAWGTPEFSKRYV
jgi:hypothetical protein